MRIKSCWNYSWNYYSRLYSFLFSEGICQFKEDSNYVLNYIKEHKDDKTTSLIVKRNGETLTSINEKEKLPLASMSKIVIAIEYTKQVAEGKIRKDEKISLKELEKYYVKNTDGGAHPAWLDDVKGKKLVKGGQTL